MASSSSTPSPGRGCRLDGGVLAGGRPFDDQGPLALADALGRPHLEADLVGHEVGDDRRHDHGDAEEPQHVLQRAARRSWPSRRWTRRRRSCPAASAWPRRPPVRLGRSRGRSSRLWYARSLVCRDSMNGQTIRMLKMRPGKITAGRNTSSGMVWPQPDPLPAGHDAQGPVEPAHVPVGLHGVGDLVRLVLAELPDGVDLGEAAQQEDDRGDHEQEPGGLGHERGEHRRADHVVLGLPLPRELGVLLFDQQAEVGGEQPDEDQRARSARGG